MDEDKVIVKALTSVTFVFVDEGHQTMKELRDRVRELLKDTGGVVKDIRLSIVEDATPTTEK